MLEQGISLELGGRWFLGDPIASYTDGIYYYTENDFFDDPYAYQNYFVSLQITRQFDIGFQGKTGFRYQHKDYAGTPALDAAGDLTGQSRLDMRTEYFIYLGKKFRTGWSLPKEITVFINLMYRDNPSNDPYYDYQDQVGLLGFSVGS